MGKTAMHANKQLGRCPNAGFVQIFDAGEMDDHFGSKFLLTI
jgi:hypothetical protein